MKAPINHRNHCNESIHAFTLEQEISLVSGSLWRSRNPLHPEEGLT
ncbi:hypothetical protein [Paenibacillus sp. MBLB4367]